MDKAEIRAKAERLGEELIGTVYPGSTEGNALVEAALTAAHDAGDKAGYERGWDEGVEAAATAYCGEYDKSTGMSMLEFKIKQIRRLKKGQGVEAKSPTF